MTIGGDQEKKVCQKWFKNNIKRLILNTPVTVVRDEEQFYNGKDHLRDEINRMKR